MVEPKNVMHLIGDIYMLNLQLILEDIDRTMKRLSSREAFWQTGSQAIGAMKRRERVVFYFYLKNIIDIGLNPRCHLTRTNRSNFKRFFDPSRNK